MVLKANMMDAKGNMEKTIQRGILRVGETLWKLYSIMTI